MTQPSLNGDDLLDPHDNNSDFQISLIYLQCLNQTIIFQPRGQAFFDFNRLETTFLTTTKPVGVPELDKPCPSWQTQRQKLQVKSKKLMLSHNFQHYVQLDQPRNNNSSSARKLR